MVPLPGPAAAPRLLLLPAAAAASPPSPGQGSVPASLSPPARKRQRLAHLSPEEKALRRKLKNRVAAQSARDRKKARLGELERQAVEMEAQNQQLQAENEALRQRTRSLARENRQLRLRLGLPVPEGDDVGAAEPQAVGAPPPWGAGEQEEQEKPPSRLAGAATGSAESAALRLRVPLQQGQAQPSPASPGPAAPASSASAQTQLAALLLLLTLLPTLRSSDLLLGILDCLDPGLFLQHYATPEEEEEEPCLEALQQEVYAAGAGSLPAPLGPSLGPAPPQLEAINELIRFDHEYTKPFFLEILADGDTQASMLVQIGAPPESAPLQAPPASVKEEPVEATSPELGGPHRQSPPALLLLDACSDSGYEGSPSPFSDLSSPLGPQDGWEEAFANELFPQLISV